MGYDIYCAICGVGFRGFHIGSSLPVALDQRDRWVSGDKNVEVSEENRPEGYDPRLVKEEDFDWLHEVYCLGFNKHATGERKTFVIGPGKYVDYGELEIHCGKDRNRPEDGHFVCYGDATSDGVIPFHRECFEILSRRLTGKSKRSEINTDILYSVMIGMSADNKTSLDQPYGEHAISCQGHYWECMPGTEYLTRDPVLNGKLILDELVLSWAGTPFESPSTSFKRLGLLERVRVDPFGELPPEIVCEICEYLSYEEFKSLSLASVHVTMHTSHGSFWKKFIWRTMPWFWEYCDEYERGRLPSILPYKPVFFWLTSTPPLYGMKNSVYMLLANRQRIWNACERIAAAYDDTKRRLSRPPRQNHRLKFDSVRSEEQWLTTVGHTRSPGTVRTVSKTWVHEWENVYEHPGNFEITLNSRKDIVGLTVRFRGKRCTFGRSLKDKTVGEEWSTEAALIPGNDWIEGMILRIPTRHRLTDPNAATAIKGVTVLLKSGGQLELGNTHGVHSERRLSVSDKCVLLGLRGDIAEDHTILRLGLVESLDPTQDETYPEEERMANAPLRVQISGPSVDDVPFVHRLLWSTEGDAFYHGNALDCRPMWEHPDVHVLPLLDPRSDEDDLAPCHIIQWASYPSDIRRLKSISAWVYTDDSVLPDADATRPVTNVLGMTAKFIKRPREPESHVGLNRRAAEEEGSSFYDKLQHFEIDGPGGEYITEVGVAADQSWSAIKLRTNRDREIVFGQQDASFDKMATATEGRVIVGLAAQFINRPRPKFEKWMQLFSLAILTKVVHLERIPLGEDLQLEEDMQSDEDMQSEASFQSDRSMLSEP